MRQNCGQQIHFLRRHFGETVEPEAGNPDFRFRISDFRTQSVRRKIQKAICILQFIFREPARIIFVEQREIVQFVAQFRAKISVFRKRAKSGGRELMLLKLAQQFTQLSGESGTPCASTKELQLTFVPHEQRAQNHDAAFVGQKFRRRDIQFFKKETRQTFERKNVQPGETLQRFVGEQLAFELERGLFGREKNQRLAFGIIFERGADFREAAESFAAAGGAEEKSRSHNFIFHAKARVRKGIYCE